MATLVDFAGASLDQIVQLLRRLARKEPAQNKAGYVMMKSAMAAMVVLTFIAGSANVRHYAGWQSTPRTRQDRYLYITAHEFPDWAATIAFRAKNNLGSMNVGQWRNAYPIQNRADPYGTAP